MRETKNLTQKELGDIIGTSITNISHWESGKNIPTINSIKMLQSYFGEGAITRQDFRDELLLELKREEL